MARRFSRARGVSGSTKPSKKGVPGWMSYKAREVELLVTKLAKEGKSPSLIGLTLRDSYGIPDVKAVTQKSITQILQSKKLLAELPEDLVALIKRRVQIQKHLEHNAHDQPAKRGLKLTDSKINALVRYYKRTERIPLEWKFDAKNATMYIE